jgi:hypothetical protein
MSRLSTAQQIQHLIPNLLVTGLAIIVTWLSYTREPVDAFLFPRIISAVMLVLALWSLGRAVMGISRTGTGLSIGLARNIAPGLIIMFVYVFWAARTMGFYVSSTIAFFLIFTAYDPAPLNDWRAWIKRIVITAAFMAVIYALFSIVLKVQTPRGMFI